MGLFEDEEGRGRSKTAARSYQVTGMPGREIYLLAAESLRLGLSASQPR
jgi:hypothetical protein